MDFYRWLKLDEMGRVAGPPGDSFHIPHLPDEGGNRAGHAAVKPHHNIDMRFEDWGVPLSDFSAWYVRLPDGRYFAHNGLMDTAVLPDEKALGAYLKAHKTKFTEVPQQGRSREDGRVHPWYDYVQVVDDNDVVKRPMYRQE